MQGDMLEETILYIQHIIEHSWQRILELEGITDEKLQIIVQQVFINFFKKSDDGFFKISELNTIEGRVAFEKVFVEECIPKSDGQYQEYFRSYKQRTARENILIEHMHEQIEFRNESIDN